MKIKDGFALRSFDDQFIVVTVTDHTATDFNRLIKLNKTAAFIWRQLEKETDRQAVLRAIQTQYSVDEITAKKDLERLLQTLSRAGLLEL